jgi:hypothetical protein
MMDEMRSKIAMRLLILFVMGMKELALSCGEDRTFGFVIGPLQEAIACNGLNISESQMRH